MKIGIIVFSNTGHTMSVSEEIKNKLLNKNIEVIPVTTLEDKIDMNINYTFTSEINLNNFDEIIFASPVHAFSLSPIMKQYLNSITSLNNKKIICFVTQQLKYPWLGGNHALKQMKAIIESKGGSVIYSADINWTNKKRDYQIESLIENISNIF